MKFLRARPSQILRGVIIVNVLALVWSLPAAAAPTDNGAPVPDNPVAATSDVPRNAARASTLNAWREARFGLFLHWGVYSVYGGTYQGKELWSAEWIQENARIPWEEYSETAANWNPNGFDAEAWVKTAQAAGMRYIVITAKHHDGFAMYPSKASEYNLLRWSKYRGPDPLAALKAACKKHGLLFGIYYSPLEFRLSPKGFDEADAQAIAKGFNYQTLGPKPYWSNAQVVKLAQAQIKELAEWYQPDIFWFDGTWEKMGIWTEADGLEAERVIRAAVPNVLINNRLGLKRGDFNTIEGKLPLKAPKGVWEYCWNLGVFWGYNPRNYAPKQMKTPAHYIETLVNTASMGGNYLLNVGPDPTGRFHPMALDYLKNIGDWVNANQECVRGVAGSPQPEKPEWGYLTQRGNKIYLIVKDWPAAGGALVLAPLQKRVVRAYLLRDAAKRPLVVTSGAKEWLIKPVTKKTDEPFTVIVLEINDQLAATP